MNNKIALVGNPNVGKSVIFNALTGVYAAVSNYPGTTVDVSEGVLKLDNDLLRIVDTPGVNSLIPHSEDELVTSDIMLDKDIRALIQVGDSKNMKRTLSLTIQLIETGLPLILDLNMYDEAKEHGINIDSKKLSQILGIEIVKTVAVTKEGVPQLKNAVARAKRPEFNVSYNPLIEEAIKKINEQLPQFLKNNRSIAVRFLLSSDEDNMLKFISEETSKKIKEIRVNTQNKTSKPLEAVITEDISIIVDRITKEVLVISKPLSKVIQNHISNFTMRPVTGTIILFFVMFLMYKFVGEFAAGTAVDFFEEKVFGKYINPFFIDFFNAHIGSIFLRELFIGQYGIITMAFTYAFAIIFPIVTAFFLFFGFLEDSGYLPRLAALSDRVFKIIGLNGRAILPMILGLGCGTMAVLTSRILDTKKERVLLTFLLALCIPCSAQLGVIMGIMSELSVTALIIWWVVIISVLLIAGYAGSRLIPGKKSSFIQEIPPVRIPDFKNIIVKTFVRLKWYLKEAVPLFVLGTVLLFFSEKTGLLIVIKKFLSPIIVGWLSLPADVAEVFIIGFLRRDYGTAGLYVLYKNGQLTHIQVLVSIIVITFFLPCIAQFFVTVKERGIKTALSILFFVFTFALLIGGILNIVLRHSALGGYL
ncbi:MAG: ferrous iron transport protein B [Elusimicrobia bacterium RIFOXYA2_FULL_39_19]|nr:MAG: ferrous iron transport protein B [Elusimicrobia bacterium RIFOXYA2_FULL_39_19]